MAVVSLLKIIAFCVTQKGPHDPLHVDFSFLASCEQNLIIFWARQCPYGTGTETGWAPQSECTRGGAVGGSGMCLRKQKMGLCEPLTDSSLPGWPSPAALQGHRAEGSSTPWRGGSLNERGDEYSPGSCKAGGRSDCKSREKSSPLQGSGEGGRAHIRVGGRRMMEPGPLWQSSQHKLLQ